MTKRAAAFLALGLLIACAALHERRPGEVPGETPAPERSDVARAATTPPRDSVSLKPIAQERELGQVSWLRDYDEARAEAKRRAKPLFVLFDEVPG